MEQHSYHEPLSRPASRTVPCWSFEPKRHYPIDISASPFGSRCRPRWRQGHFGDAAAELMIFALHYPTEQGVDERLLLLRFDRLSVQQIYVRTSLIPVQTGTC